MQWFVLLLFLQQQPGEVRIRSGAYHPAAILAVETNLVELGATVRDHKGRPAGGLQASDFAILDNGKPQKITFFSEQRSVQRAASSSGAATGMANASGVAAPQRSIALFFDDTHSGAAGFERSRRAAQKLITEGLSPGDRIGIFTGSGAVELDFTGDTQTLLSTLEKMRRHPDQPGNSGFGVCPTLTAYQAYVIAKRIDPGAKEVAAMDIMGCAPATPWLIALDQAQEAGDAAWEQLQHQSTDVLDVLMQVVGHLAKAPGARILLMVSPGFVTDNIEKRSDAITETCLRAHIVVNALDDEGLIGAGTESPESLGARSGPRVGWAEKSLMQRSQILTEFMGDAAAATGGKLITNNNDLLGSLRTLEAAPEVSYVLGFSPAEKPNGKYHKLKVTIAKAGYEVSARPGYFSTIDKEKTETAQQRIDRVVGSEELLDQVPATVKVSALADKSGQARVQVEIRLDAKRLPFGKQNGASIQQLTFVTILEDAAGKYVDGKEALMDLALSTATRTRLEQQGIQASTSFTVPKGSYRVREVIREAVQNQIAASTSTVEAR